jgi:hypothetical protein
MTQPHDQPQDTREFLVQWNAATEAHLTERLTELLEALSAMHEANDASSVTDYAVLAPHLLHALQIAANPGSTVHDAIEYLAGLVGEGRGEGGD